MKFSAVILAGGKSSRMGRDKAWLVAGGQTLLARQIELARKAGATEIFISGRTNSDYSEFDGRVLRDKFPDAGPLAGIERALDECSAPLLLVLAVDLPKMTATLLRKLAAHCSESRGAVPRVVGRIEPLAAFYPKSAGSLAATLLSGGFNAVTAFAEQCVKSKLAVFADMPANSVRCFTNWNSPEAD